ncbi:MAG: hypothetical protein JKY48_09555 [Flavobacteriales bacterium]|nr:hypothetical protein [Flavobacteriales bacterium]
MSHPSIENTKKRNLPFSSTFLVGLLFFTFYLLGDFFPDYWWSTHSSHFIGKSLKYAGFLFALFFLILSFFPKGIQQISRLVQIPKKLSHPIIWFLSLLMGFLFYQFPMLADFYGEAYLLNSQAHQTVISVSQEAHNELFTFGLNPWAGQKTIFALISYIAYFSGETIYTCILYFDAFFGFCFMLTWLYFIHGCLKNWTWKFILTLAVCTAPFLLNFYGHLEINAIVLWVNLFWTTQLVRYFNKRDSKSLWMLFLLFILCLKIHAISVLFAPVLIYLCIAHYLKASVSSNFITWRRIFAFVLAPVFAIGAFCYFFVFKDYNDPRNLDFTVTEYDRLFLPILSPEAPLDRYSLFSFNHIFDYFSELLLWSPIALFLLVVIVISYRKRVNWQQEELILTSTLLILFASFFFVVNPLLSMQMDWDLFSFPTPILLVVTVLLIKQLEDSDLWIKAMPICFAIAILNVPFFMVHSSRTALSQKLESLGIRIYQTYYEWSAQTIHNSFGLIENDRTALLDRRNKLLYKISDYSIEGNDREYGILWRKGGEQFLKIEHNYSSAYVYLEKALSYYPEDKISMFYMIETCLLLDLPEEAYQYSLALQPKNYPSEKAASITVIQSALFASYYDKALEHSELHLVKWPDDLTMKEINYRLSNKLAVEELKNFFIKN